MDGWMEWRRMWSDARWTAVVTCQTTRRSLKRICLLLLVTRGSWQNSLPFKYRLVVLNIVLTLTPFTIHPPSSLPSSSTLDLVLFFVLYLPSLSRHSIFFTPYHPPPFLPPLPFLCPPPVTLPSIYFRLRSTQTCPSPSPCPSHPRCG